MANVVYNSFFQKIMDGSIDLDTDTLKLALVTSDYTPNVDNDEDWADVVANESEGTGYTAGGVTLANKAVTKDNTNDQGKFDADDVVWSNSTVTARGAVLYKASGENATSWLICYIDFVTDLSSAAGTFTITWSEDGILTIGN